MKRETRETQNAYCLFLNMVVQHKTMSEFFLHY